ncbi:MAG: AIR synthase family protein [Burkholderiales bacterium]
MRKGKLTNEQLKSIVFSRLHPKREVLLRAGVGEDCAALDFNGEACVLSTDPLTGAAANAGSLAVHISCNDVASSGAQPEAMLVTLLIPPDKTLEEVEQIVDELASTADELGIDIIGGHTEVTDAVNRIVVSTTVIGRIESGRLVTSGGARPGDYLIITGYAATEGTFIIANDYRQRLKGILTYEDEKAIEALGKRISVVREGVLAGRLGASAMHDVTEGGVYGAVHELCEASGAGCDLYAESIPVLDVTKKICSFLGINPFRLIGSGSMLIAAPDSQAMIDGLKANGISAAVIGKITERDVCVIENGKRNKLAPPMPDELFSL